MLVTGGSETTPTEGAELALEIRADTALAAACALAARIAAILRLRARSLAS